MENTFDKTALETIDLLEARLKRIEYAVCGHIDQSALPSQKQTAVQRMGELEHSLHQIASKSSTIQDLLKLHSRYPDLFQQISPSEIPDTLDTSTLLSIVLASASSYSSTASRLTSVNDTPIPPTELSTQLINLHPRIAKISALQTLQSVEITELRERSAALVQKWYTTGVLGQGETWAELEGRVGRVEQKVRRTALAKRMDDELV
ncbi:hypothetical protein GLAREA_09091 [Glarea lozoyensis ATCC 20868]|uniref:Nuclear distribution protein RO10 n=1 Tax=Glarea lozoyensis (strain ATCC 20868 / MF5171) TaxID=1116229 RepID=S3EFG7_GLAL2|nr:uncharacterized protein GLAREA_09091 [Glarea lozoyensis ATCC 20868]EPE36928.1 hypothetical protein GLAREA_09091 [Glarea lozoyensis ATCC 20868]